MRLQDVLHSCSHGRVAEAAVVSIGGPFANRVRSFAEAEGLSLGDYASRTVKVFFERADERDLRAIASTMTGADLALLAGVEAMITRMLPDGAGGLEV